MRNRSARRTPSVCARFGAVLIAASVSSAPGALVATGQVSPAPLASWSGATTGYIGESGVGSITVDGASALTSFKAYLGYSAASDGSAAVVGSGSTWTLANSLYVGNGGNGTLGVLDAGKVTSQPGYIGYNPGSTGHVVVGGAGSQWTVTDLYVGYFGTGSLLINNGGAVTGSSSYLSSSSAALGTVIVDGTGSTLSLLGVMSLGDGGGGTLVITNGGKVTNSGIVGYGNIGLSGAGNVTVDGTGSAWNLSNDLTIGSYGTGTLTITNGGVVSTQRAARISNGSDGSAGTVDFGTNGGTLTAASLYASPFQVTGKGTINTVGIVTDQHLLFDATHGRSQSLLWNSPGQNVMVNINVATTGDLGAGYYGTGSLTIKDSQAIHSRQGYLGHKPGSVGMAAVQGNGDWLTSGDLFVGNDGAGTLAVSGGGWVSTGGSGLLGVNSGSSGKVSVHGPASEWSIRSELTVGGSGSGSLAITNGGKVTTYGVYVGRYAGATGTVAVDGSGSTLTVLGGLGGRLTLGYFGNAGTGTMTISRGGKVSAFLVQMGNSSLLDISVGDGSLLSVAGEVYSTSSTIRLKAVPAALPGTYTPIAATYVTPAAVQALGGTWLTSNHTVTISTMATGDSPVTVDRSQVQRVSIADPLTGRTLIANVLAATVPTSLTLSTAPLSASQSELLRTAAGPNAAFLASTSLSATGYGAIDPLYLSLRVGGGFHTLPLALWHFDGSAWAKAGTDLSYDGTFASFTAPGAGGYALTTAAVAGDVNLDNKVDAFDLNLLAANWQGSGKLWSGGDFNADGIVDAFDLNLLAANWQAGAAGLLPEVAGWPAGPWSSVPEPGTLAIVGGAAALLTLRRGGRRTAQRR